MTGFIGLGSNLGDRRAYLGFGVERLRAEGVELRAVSSIWESEPVASSTSMWFLNMVVEVDVRRPPLALLDSMLEVERGAGRLRGAPNAPRTLDLDLLLLDDMRLEGARLRLPHPRMWQRRFVLEPLVEIAPGVRNPATGRTALEELREIRGGGVVVKFGRLARSRALPL